MRCVYILEARDRVFLNAAVHQLYYVAHAGYMFTESYVPAVFVFVKLSEPKRSPQENNAFFSTGAPSPSPSRRTTCTRSDAATVFLQTSAIILTANAFRFLPYTVYGGNYSFIKRAHVDIETLLNYYTNGLETGFYFAYPHTH